MSQLLEKIMSDVKVAMKAKDKDRLLTLRTLHSNVKKVAIDSRKEVTDSDVLQVISKGIKQREEAKEQFLKAVFVAPGKRK